MPETDDLPEYHDLPEEKTVRKLNKRDLIEQVLLADDEDKALMLRIIFNDLQMDNMVKAGAFFGFSENWVKKTKEITNLGGKNFTRLIKDENNP